MPPGSDIVKRGFEFKEAGVRSQESGVGSQESGVGSQESGVRRQEAEVGTPREGRKSGRRLRADLGNAPENSRSDRSGARQSTAPGKPLHRSRAASEIAHSPQLLFDFAQEQGWKKVERPPESAIVDGAALIDHHLALLAIPRNPFGKTHA
jgi:hypothetical protein